MVYYVPEPDLIITSHWTTISTNMKTADPSQNKAKGNLARKIFKCGVIFLFIITK